LYNPNVKLPIWLFDPKRDGTVDRLDDLESLGLTLEWLNTDHKLAFPKDTYTGLVLLDDLGRRLNVVIEFAEVMRVSVVNYVPVPDDLALLAFIREKYVQSHGAE
jgi:hypothetical protein